jgi:hypothetical protein
LSATTLAKTALTALRFLDESEPSSCLKHSEIGVSLDRRQLALTGMLDTKARSLPSPIGKKDCSQET